MTARLCGKRYTPPGCEVVTAITWHCADYPDHAGTHSGDMGPHVLTREIRQAYEFGADVTQQRAVCSCRWRSSWFTDWRYLVDPERRHLAEATR